MSRTDFVDYDDFLDFQHKWRDDDCHPQCGEYGECACGPCTECDDDGMVDRDIPDPHIGWKAVYGPCPTCDGTKVDPEAMA